MICYSFDFKVAVKKYYSLGSFITNFFEKYQHFLGSQSQNFDLKQLKMLLLEHWASYGFEPELLQAVLQEEHFPDPDPTWIPGKL
jgi:hypothetical protein